MNESIIVKGAREHNLKNITVKIPKNKLVVFTGVSGSGKTSLAMDTLYAEGQRRYVESLSAYARQFLGMMRRPEVDKIEGLSPAIAIDQRALSANPRSTVGTVTEIYDYLRLLFARIGHPHCPQCGREVVPQTSQSITDQIIELLKKRSATRKNLRFLILSPVVRDKRGEFNKLFQNLKNKGFDQVRIDGKIFGLDEDLFLIRTNRHNIEVIVDKLCLTKKDLANKTTLQRVKDDIEISLELADGLVVFGEIMDKGFGIPDKPTQIEDSLFSQRLACPQCNISIPELEPRLFSFNSPHGACPECNGLGVKLRIDTDRVSSWRAFRLERQYYNTTSDVIRQEIEKLMIKEDCPTCQGDRLKTESLKVTIGKKNIASLTYLPLDSLYQWLDQFDNELKSVKEKQIAKPIVGEINTRLSFLNAVGLSYLTLSRPTSTLSVGEGQRIRLASQIGSGLSGVLYILDEPTVGLHARDTRRLIDTLYKLRDLGNTVIVVEHDPGMIESADWVIDFGPGAGKKGGRITAAATPAQIKKRKESLTGQYLAGKKKISLFPNNCQQDSHLLAISGCRTNNLKNITVKLPLEKMICLTGVSGSGKSSLLIDTLYPAIKKALNPDYKERVGDHDQLSGLGAIKKVLMVDQALVGRTSRSNPATYIGVFTDIRQIFAQVREARLKGFNASFFSFNVVGGRCEACQGQGRLKVQMQFLPDIWVDCEECQGQRYKTEVLEVEFKERNIAQVLRLTIDEARDFFEAIPAIARKLEVLQEVGLGYLELGQLSPTLSGGESQRLKIARELVKKSEGGTIYFLDEPTTGLHFADLEKLLRVLRQLVDRGNTVVVIEHNLEIIKQADWIVDLGPEGGENGGYIVGEGAPQEVAQNEKSWTGKYLKQQKIRNSNIEIRNRSE